MRPVPPSGNAEELHAAAIILRELSTAARVNWESRFFDSDTVRCTPRAQWVKLLAPDVGPLIADMLDDAARDIACTEAGLTVTVAPSALAAAYAAPLVLARHIIAAAQVAPV